MSQFESDSIKTLKVKYTELREEGIVRFQGITE